MRDVLAALGPDLLDMLARDRKGAALAIGQQSGVRRPDVRAGVARAGLDRRVGRGRCPERLAGALQLRLEPQHLLHVPELGDAVAVRADHVDSANLDASIRGRPPEQRAGVRARQRPEVAAHVTVHDRAVQRHREIGHGGAELAHYLLHPVQPRRLAGNGHVVDHSLVIVAPDELNLARAPQPLDLVGEQASRRFAHRGSA